MKLFITSHKSTVKPPRLVKGIHSLPAWHTVQGENIPVPKHKHTDTLTHTYAHAHAHTDTHKYPMTLMHNVLVCVKVFAGVRWWWERCIYSSTSWEDVLMHYTVSRTYMHVHTCPSWHLRGHFWDKECSAKHWNRLCPYFHVNSAVEVPPSDYDVLHVTGIHPHRILMWASVKIAALGLFMRWWSLKEKRDFFVYFTGVI